MKLDDLPVDKQETATYCHSCGEVRGLEQLGLCLGCGAHVCGLDGCSLRCACDDASLEVQGTTAEARTEGSPSANVLPPSWDAPSTRDEVTAILQQIDSSLIAYSHKGA